ncbi:MAG: hypothetical protein WBC44_18495 [Planctomycetaceae bacterium]
MIPSFLIRRIALLIILFAADGVLPAEEPATDAPPATTDEALLRSLLGEDESNMPDDDSPTGNADDDPMKPAAQPEPVSEKAAASLDPDAAERLLTGLKNAEENLADGDTGESTRTAQSDVIAELSRLIEEAQQQSESASGDESGQEASGSPRPQPTGATPSQPMPTGRNGDPTPAGAAGVSNGPPERNREENAEESSERVREESTPENSIRDFRSGLVRDVWGHLPERMRDQLLNVGPDRYLPEYDALVREYFESLARPQPPPERSP